VEANSLASWVYKRGANMAKTWKSRWMVIEDGYAYYYSDASDRQKGAPPLGALAFASRSAAMRIVAT